MIKRIFKWSAALVGVLIVATALLAVQTWYFKPLSFSWFLDRALLRHTLEDPELLTQLRLLEPLGFDGHNARLTDVSVKQDERVAEQWQQDLDTLHQYDRAAMSSPQQLAYDVMDWYVGTQVENTRWQYHDYPVNPLFGVQSELPTMMATQQSVTNAHEADQYLQRLDGYGKKFRQLLEGLRLREERGIIPPAFVVHEVLEQMRAFVGVPAEQNMLYVAFADKLESAKSIGDDQRGELLAKARDRITNDVYPAYDQLIAYFERLQPKARTNNGVWALPNGDGYYAFKVRQNTTTDMTPEELHQLGLAEVARIESEMDAILREQGYTDGSVGARMTQLGNEPRFLYANTDEGRAQCLADFQKIIDDVSAGMGVAFAHLPTSKVVVKRVPEFKEKTSPQAYYDPAPLDGSRPGTFWVNLRDVTEIKKFSMRTLAYHEAVPGHHFQISIARGLKDVSTVQRVLPFTAYTEGWALYAEHLAKELGYESDPFDDLGRLRDEQFRAVRLVVDTGLHYKRWTREQAINYMLDKTGMAEGDVVAEIERYLVMPGQALAYKTGMLKIMELRARAQQALGDRFNLKEFHDQVLMAGALPLGVLEARVDRWIDGKRKTAAPAGG
jgi:uncharacterized protein (DUF885 family)